MRVNFGKEKPRKTIGSQVHYQTKKKIKKTKTRKKRVVDAFFDSLNSKIDQIYVLKEGI